MVSQRSVDPSTLTRRELYAAMTACIVPRPIGWASTVDTSGGCNLAPFSFFGGVTSDPFTVMLSVGRRRRERKDTAVNILASGEAVVHIPNEAVAQKMVMTSAEVESSVDEFDYAGLTKIPSDIVKPPRVVEAALAFECKMTSHREVGNGPVDMFLLEVVRLHIADEVVGDDGWPDPDKLRAVARLGGPHYAIAAPTFAVPRPKV